MNGRCEKRLGGMFSGLAPDVSTFERVNAARVDEEGNLSCVVSAEVDHPRPIAFDKDIVTPRLLTSGAMTAALSRLERESLVRRTSDTTDLRVRYVSLTPKGIKLIDKAIEVRFEQAEGSLTDLTQTERNQLAGLLSKLLQSLDG